MFLVLISLVSSEFYVAKYSPLMISLYIEMVLLTHYGCTHFMEERPESEKEDGSTFQILSQQVVAKSELEPGFVFTAWDRSHSARIRKW